MTVLDVVLDLTGYAKSKIDRPMHHVTTMTIGALPAGMSSGLPSVGICIDLPNGEYVFAETSLKLFLNAADALKARYGDPR